MTLHGWGWLAALGLLLFGVSRDAFAREPVRRALVVAFNGTENPKRPPLQYADDDGLLWMDVLTRLGFETQLLTVADSDTARRRPPLLDRAVPPTSTALATAVSRIAQANRADRDAGRSTEVMVVYVGHGDIAEDGHAFLTLLDRDLDASALYSRVIDALEADFIHLLVDACHASGVIGSRGELDPKALRRLQGMLERKELERRPHVGVAFAESDTGQTHEWSRWRAGVFSHLARSALLGGADINGDERIEYSELQAFVSAALAGLENAPSSLTIHTTPPAQAPRRPLRTLPPSGPALTLAPTRARLRLSIEDSGGTRLVDVHRASGERLRLVLPTRERYWVRTPDGEASLSRAELEAGMPALNPLELGDRGPVAERFREGLFRVPFGRAFYEGFATTSGIVPVELPASAEPLPEDRVHAPSAQEANAPPAWELGASLSRAPLGAGAWAMGVTGAWRAGLFPWRPGVQVAYGIAPRSWLNGGTLHRISVLGTLGWETPRPLSATAELGAGWTLLGVTAPWGHQADLGVLTGRAAAGLRFPFQGLTWRAQAHLLAEWATRDGARQWNLSPGATLTVAL
ncbi:caspase family protein [Myxococcus stipitatus]|uniref:caspase family protein n=1 Tax=Myxococcus stipitatus TaxID=83455 RepID=UPI00314563DE